MATESYACPLNVDVEQKALEKLSINEENTSKTLDWMSAVLGVEISSDMASFAVTIQDGEMLCSLLNVLQPGTVKRVHTNIARDDAGKLKPMSMSKARENVTSFLHGAQTLGVPKSSLFDTLDVVDSKDMNLVVQCLGMLGRKVSTMEGYSGPTLYASGDTSSIQSKLDAAKKANETVPTIFSTRGGGHAKTSPLMPSGGTTSTKAPEEFSCPLEDQIKEKAQEKLLNMADERDSIERWMQAVLGENCAPNFNVDTSLKDGQLLCSFVNRMFPGTITKVHQVNISENGEFTASARFKAQENVTAFIKACQTVGVPQSCVFDTLDVVDSKDMNGVLQCLSALGRAVSNRTDYTGPQLHKSTDASAAAQKLLARQHDSKSSTDNVPTIFRN